VSIKPILFNTDMVRAILDGRKTVTRRKIDIDISNRFDVEIDGTVICYIDQATGDSYKPTDLCRYQPGDILYVRETWNRNPLNEYGNEPEKYIYKATYDGHAGEVGWHPSIHMPNEAARIWLKVTNVRVERLHDMPHDAAGKEGIHYCECPDGFTWKTDTDMNCCYTTPLGAFKTLWNSTINKEDFNRYGWKANPWVWVMEFERCEKPVAD